MIANNIPDIGVDCNNKQYKRTEKSLRMKDLTGIKFERLTPLFPVKLQNKSHKYWLCLCDCGKLKAVLPDSLMSKQTRSCGCLRSETTKQHITKINHSRRLNLKNQIFGSLLVMDEEPVRQNETYHYYWKCYCNKCGNFSFVRSDILTSGNKIFCDKCNNFFSQGERKIYDLLKNNNIHFETQKIFDNCRFPDTNFVAKFDFYIDNKYIIEFDGRQHFKEYKNFNQDNPDLDLKI